MSEPHAEPAPDPEPESYSRWDQRPALSRRGMVLVGVVPVLIAAAAFGVVAWVSHDSDTSAQTLRVPTSGWIPGQDGGDDLIQGTLEVDQRHCVYLQGGEGQIWPVWPAGYRARLSASGGVSLYDGSDDLVARNGEALRATGTQEPASAYTGESCLPSDGRVAVVESEVVRLG